MDHRELMGRAEEAIGEVFSDTSVDREETAMSLSDLADIIEDYMNAL